MELDKRNIEEYINRFLEGETTNAEEQAIYRFFHTGDVPSHLMGYAPMFAWYEGGMQGEPGMSQPDGQEEVAGGKRSEKIPVVGKEGFYQRIPVAVWSATKTAIRTLRGTEPSSETARKVTKENAVKTKRPQIITTDSYQEGKLSEPKGAKYME